MVANPEITKCTCPDVLCEWHGKCKECIALHRAKKHHLPARLHFMLEDNIKNLLQMVEMTAIKVEKTSPEYRNYVKERDKQEEHT